MTEPTIPAIDRLLVGDVMSGVGVTIGPDESVLMAFELMSRAHTRHLAVVTPEGCCLGLLDAMTLMQEWYPAPLARQRRPVSAVMRERMPVVRATDALRFAAEQLLVNDIDGMAVVGEDRRVVGIVTSRDIVAAVAGRSAVPA